MIVLKELDLSLVIACYNEKLVLENSFKEIQTTLDGSGLDYEIIFVDDKSKDNTREIIKKIVAKNKNTKFLFHKKNEGRGKTVSDGIKIARGKVAGFTDIDLSTPAHYIPLMVQKVFGGNDIVLAERVYRVDFSSFFRWILSRGYNLLMKTMLDMHLKDTETGCKFFKRKKILPILDKIQDKHWFWDTEIMVLSYLNGLKILEFPTAFIRRNETGSTLRLFRDTLGYFIKLLRFRARLNNLKREIST